MNETKINILVTATGGAVGQGIIKSIKLSTLNHRIVATDAQPFAAGLYRANAGYIVPLAESPYFIDKVIEICNEENIHVICIGTQLELMTFAENKKRIQKEANAKVIVSSPEVIKITNDKWKTYSFLKRHHLPFPPSVLPERVDAIIKEEGFPLIIKPRTGTSSQHVYIVRNPKELRKYLPQVANPIIQKYLPQEEREYTSTTLTFNKKCYGVLSMNRVMRFGGHTTKAIIEEFPEFNKTVKKATELLNPFGPCNFQWRLTEKGPTIFEINCRFSGTSPFCAELGFNTVDAAIRHVVLNEKLKPLKQYKKGIILRYFNEVYIPFREYDKLSKQKYIHTPQSKVCECF